MFRAAFIPRHASILGFAILLFAVFTLPAFAQEVLFEIYTDAQSPVWGKIIPTATHRIAQEYTPDKAIEICEVGHKVKRSTSNSADDIVMRLYEGGEQPEQGTLLAEVFIPRSSLGLVFPSESLRFSLPECLGLKEATTYWFVWAHSNPYYLRNNGFQSTYRGSSQVENTKYWQYEGYVSKGGEGWKQYPDREWSFTLFGTSLQDIPVKTPVIIVPGILGSELKKGDDLLWPDLSQMLFDINDEFLIEGLALDPDGAPDDVEVGEVSKTINLLNIISLKDLFNGLEEEFSNEGYAVEDSLFYFPYDWRIDLELTKELLRQKIEDVKAHTGAEKVNIVAHSMGGLLTEVYMETHGVSNIDKLIFIGTPHLGAPKAGKALLFGDRFNIPILEDTAMKAVSLNAPAVYELLPSSKYFDEFNGYLRELGSEEMFDYQQSKDFLISSGLNWNLIDRAEAFFEKELHNVNLGDTEVYNIAGCETPTQAGYELNKERDGVEAIGYTSGDKTVPLASADYVNAEHKYYVRGASHAELPSMSGVRDLIVDIVNGESLALSENISEEKDFCGFTGKELIWHSPVEVHIYDEFNNHTGPAEDNTIEYNIAGVDYDIIGEHKFIFLPAGRAYRVVASGLSNGTFDLFIRENNNGEVTRTKLFNDVVITPESKTEFVVSSETTDSELIIYEGDDPDGFVVGSQEVVGLEAGEIIAVVPKEDVEQEPAVEEVVVASASEPAPVVEVIHRKSGPSRSTNPQVLGAAISAEEWREGLMKQLLELLMQLLALLQEQQKLM